MNPGLISPSAAATSRRDRVDEPRLSEEQLFAALHPEISAWTKRRFGHFSPAQLLTIPEIMERRSTLLSSPTGTGKTLAAFLGVFDHLGRAREARALPAGIVAVYISPLRSLAYDLQKNLQEPLSELGWNFVRLSSRTGDTSPKDRAAQKRKPPHILVTTPESLTLMLSQPTWLPAFRSVRFLIIDELHALAENKRGSLLMVAAERLEEVVACRKPDDDREPEARVDEPRAAPATQTRASGSRPPASAPRPPASGLIRIGLSATVHPLDTVAEFLVGPARPCRIVNVTQRRPAHIELFSPLHHRPYPPAGWTGQRIMKELAQLLLQKRTTLLFTNTRSGAETIGLRLKQELPEWSDQIEVHHASLDRAVRLEVEARLKRGELRAVVCSTSLEMGIDIGSIDTVVMVSAPKGVARALQRIGRSGHSIGETSHGILVATNINDLVECTATARMMERRDLEPVRIHDNPLDVLAQHLVGLAIFGSATPDEAYALVRQSYPFRDLPRSLFDRVLRYLEGGGTSLERAYRDVFGKIRLENGVLVLPNARVARDFYQNVGTITSEPAVQIRLGRRTLGQVEESFVKRLRPGDIFVLNGRCVRLVETRLLTAKVVEAGAALPTVPRWYANKFPLTSGLAVEVAKLRTEFARRLDGRWLADEYGISLANAAAIERHFKLQAGISAIPTTDFFLVECYRDRDHLHYFFHSLIGRSANDALSRIVAWRVKEAKGGNALVTIDDYGFLLSLRSFQQMDVPEWQALFRREGAEESLRSALAEADLVKWQFRGVAQTGLMVPRRVHGQERGARALQWSSEIIFDVLRRHEPDHPLLQESYAEATLRFLDAPRGLAFLDEVQALPWKLCNVDRVSPFSFGIYVSKVKETMMLEDPETTIERLYHEMYGAAEDGQS